MLTSRGWWFLAIDAFLLVLGAVVLPNYTVVPAILALTLLAWFAAEWVMFQVRVNAAVSRLKVTRRVVQGGRDVPMVWAGLAFEVRVRVHHDGPVRVPFALFEDRLPQAAELVAGDPREFAHLAADEEARIDYTLKGPATGVLRFEGVRVRVADLHGFFYHRAFLRDEIEYLILPPLTDDEGRQRADKRFNTLPPPGIHRLRRPGSGGELLDLRDYRPGDPPKMIAWKASARRDRLITKEYESDVPVRCVLFLDTSEGMRLGPPGHTPLTRMAAVASGVAQAAAGNRDLVGLTTFGEDAAKGTSPARTKLHMIDMLRRLAEAAALQPGTTGVPPEQLTGRAFPLAVELYPELMTRRTNSMPLGRLWIPLLDRGWGWIVLFAFLYPWLLIGSIFNAPRWFWKPWVEGMAVVAEGITRHKGGTWVNFLILMYIPVLIGGLVWLIYGIRGWFGERRTQLTRRKQLAALFALRDGTGPGGIERLIHDDEAYAERVGRFLNERQIRVPIPLYDDRGHYRYRCAGKTAVLADALVRAVGRARDNELYVILADLAELGPDLAPLLKAARVARARHHQVMVIVPWPADVPPPDDKPRTEPVAPPDDSPMDRLPWEKSKKKPRKHRPVTPIDRTARLLPVIQAALTRQYHEGFRKLRRSLGQVGATVVRVNEGDPVQVVLDRLDRLRGMRSRR
ncbi:MAG: hypothetical protein JWO38_6467 [Gemmataceae bacterium]|nr:hypothetical protein [Gemmataceae bacterium]